MNEETKAQWDRLNVRYKILKEFLDWDSAELAQWYDESLSEILNSSGRV